MKPTNVFKCCALAILLLATSVEAKGEVNIPTTLESLIGKFDGVIQVDKINPVEHRYQTEVVSIDRSAGTVSLTAYCFDCETKHWKRKGCKLTESLQSINFACKGQVSDEKYSFDGKSLVATGFGNKYPYSIHVTKISDVAQ